MLDPTTGNGVRVYNDADTALAEERRHKVLAIIDAYPQTPNTIIVRNYLATQVLSVEEWLSRRTWRVESLMMDAYRRATAGK